MNSTWTAVLNRISSDITMLQLDRPLLIRDNYRLFLGATSIALAALVARYIRSPRRKLPPGPPGLPFLGNALDIRSAQWLNFTKWKETYGDIVYLSALGQDMIILNTQKAAADLMDRRAAIYSDRPHNIVSAQILCGGMAMVFQGYTSLWRRMRKATHESLNKTAVEAFQPTQFVEAIALAQGLLKEPHLWDDHLRRTAASMVMSVTYDTPMLTSAEDPRVREVNDFTARLTRSAMPGAHLVEFLPWLMYVPRRFAKWRREAEEWHAKDSAMFERLLLNVKTEMDKGRDHPSLSATLLKNSKRYDLSVKENTWLAATMYAAGAETTSAVMAWWTLAMVMYPDVQARAQAELDSVVGRDRVPTFEDFPNLSYIRAMVKEALRWRPVDPMGLPHRSSQDDWYEGHFIPKGSIVIANVWALHCDSGAYGQDADHFNPARFLGEDGKVAPGPADSKEEGHFTYGFGRRVCVGKHVANNSIFIDIAITLWACNIARAKEPETGNPIPIDVDGWIEDGLVVRPVPFKCSITPRFPEAPALLASENMARG
ncbi:unnamed protein product [Peniophora sp. CBMAI 1063]|nr:unnamed protein product [Peniophora sp. CBMAI 1063]